MELSFPPKRYHRVDMYFCSNLQNDYNYLDRQKTSPLLQK